MRVSLRKRGRQSNVVSNGRVGIPLGMIPRFPDIEGAFDNMNTCSIVPKLTIKVLINR